jgi:hypothetical protein
MTDLEFQQWIRMSGPVFETINNEADVATRRQRKMLDIFQKLNGKTFQELLERYLPI